MSSHNTSSTFPLSQRTWFDNTPSQPDCTLSRSSTRNNNDNSNTTTQSKRPLTPLSFSWSNSRRQSNYFLGTRPLASLSSPTRQQTPKLSPFSLFTAAPLAPVAYKSPSLRDIESPVSTMTVNSSPQTLMPPPPPSRPSSQVSGSALSRAESGNTSNIKSQSNRPNSPSSIFGLSRSQQQALSQKAPTSPSSAVAEMVDSPCHSSQTKPYMPSYMSAQPQQRLTEPSSDEAFPQKKILLTSGAPARSRRTISLQEKWQEDAGRLGSTPNDVRSSGGEDTPEGSVVESIGQDQSQSLASFARSSDFLRLESKTTAIDITVGRLSQTVGAHSQWIKQHKAAHQITIGDAGKDTIAWMDQKGDELIQSVTSEAEMAIQRIEETAQSCNDILNRQLQVAVDTIQGAVDMMQEWLRQAQVSQERTIHEAITELQRAVADQLQRNSDAVEMAGTRAIALLERKGDELIKSTEMRAEIMAQRMDEIPKRWKETLADHKNTVLEVIPDMARSSQPEQAPSWAQGMEAWMTRFDTRFSSEVMAIKDVLTVQSQTLNAYAQQHQRVHQEQGLQLLRSAHQIFNNEGGSTSGERLSPTNHRSSRSPSATSQGERGNISQQPEAHPFSFPSVATKGYQSRAHLKTVHQESIQVANTQMHPVGAPAVASPNNTIYTVQAVTPSASTPTTTRVKRPYIRRAAAPPITSTVRGAKHPPTSAARGSSAEPVPASFKAKKARCPTTKAAIARQQILISTGELTNRVLSTAAKGKHVVHQESQATQPIDATTTELSSQAAPSGSPSPMVANTATSCVTSSSSLSSASSNDASDLGRKDAGAEREISIITQSLGDSTTIPKDTPARRGRGRPRKNPDNARSSTPTKGPSLSGGNKRRRVMRVPSLVPLQNFRLAADPQRISIAIKAEDVVQLTPRLTRATKIQQRSDSVFLDLESVRKKVQEAGGSWRI